MSNQPAKPAKSATFQTAKMREIAWHVWSYFDINNTIWTDDSGHYNFGDLIAQRQRHLNRLAQDAISIEFEFPRGYYILWHDGSKVNPGILIRAWKRYQRELQS